MMKLETKIILRELNEDFQVEIETGLKFLEAHLATVIAKQELQNDRFGLKWLPYNYLRQNQLYLMGLFYHEYNVNPGNPTQDL